jgi:hypothetical protein
MVCFAGLLPFYILPFTIDICLEVLALDQRTHVAVLSLPTMQFLDYKIVLRIIRIFFLTVVYLLVSFQILCAQCRRAAGS